MDPAVIRSKFGEGLVADAHTFVMGIDRRFTTVIAQRFRDRRVLETCTGAGFSTIELARVAAHVTTAEINPAHQAQARHNVKTAGLLHRVTFVLADIMDETTWEGLPAIEAAFLDPDWAITGPQHVHHFRNSTTRPPADALLDRVFRATRNIALILPPSVAIDEFAGLPLHELQRLYLGERHELYCLYFGDLAVISGETELRA